MVCYTQYVHVSVCICVSINLPTYISAYRDIHTRRERERECQKSLWGRQSSDLQNTVSLPVYVDNPC